MSGYTGSLDEDTVSDLIRQFGRLVEEAGEVGFVLTYHAVDKPGSGRMNLAGTGINQAQLAILLADALEHNATHGSTA